MDKKDIDHFYDRLDKIDKRTTEMMQLINVLSYSLHKQAGPSVEDSTGYDDDSSFKMWISEKSKKVHMKVGKRFILLLGPKFGPFIYNNRAKIVWLFSIFGVVILHFMRKLFKF